MAIPSNYFKDTSKSVGESVEQSNRMFEGFYYTRASLADFHKFNRMALFKAQKSNYIAVLKKSYEHE